ncbi:MAG: hypothetical protein K0M48_01545 [Thiobacillus sp.]|nr:hypothetical protein [Thiobacillus sp.]
MHSASLLVAALVMLRRPCTRNRITAGLLLARAARDTTLSPAEREACLNLVDELEQDAQSASLAPGRPANRCDAASTPWILAIQ